MGYAPTAAARTWAPRKPRSRRTGLARASVRGARRPLDRSTQPGCTTAAPRDNEHPDCPSKRARPERASSARSCRIRAQTGHNIQPTAVSPHLSGLLGAAGTVVYKTAGLPTELHRRETPSVLADPPNRLITPDTCPCSQQIWASAQFGAVSVQDLEEPLGRCLQRATPLAAP